MSFEYQIRMVCDRCGAEIEPWAKARTLEQVKCAKWRCESNHRHDGVMIGLPSRYGKYSIFCQPCADGKGVKMRRAK
jgi:hypothetical protein